LRLSTESSAFSVFYRICHALLIKSSNVF